MTACTRGLVLLSLARAPALSVSHTFGTPHMIVGRISCDSRETSEGGGSSSDGGGSVGGGGGCGDGGVDVSGAVYGRCDGGCGGMLVCVYVCVCMCVCV
jgi:hypothetical protein